MTRIDTDADLIARTANTPHEFEEVFRRHFRPVHRFLARRAPRHIADELAAEVFTTAFAQRARYDHSYADARPWLLGIANNLLRADARRSARDGSAHARYWNSDADESRAGYDEADDRLDAARTSVLAAVNELPPDEREVLLLIAWDGVTPAEAARTLGLPAGTVRSRLHRARHSVRAHLEAAHTPAAPADLFTKDLQP